MYFRGLAFASVYCNMYLIGSASLPIPYFVKRTSPLLILLSPFFALLQMTYSRITRASLMSYDKFSEQFVLADLGHGLLVAVDGPAGSI